MQAIWAFLKSKKNLAAVFCCLALVAFIGSLLGANYWSQKELQESALNQLRQKTEKRASAVGYFYEDRKQELKNLAESRIRKRRNVLKRLAERFLDGAVHRTGPFGGEQFKPFLYGYPEKSRKLCGDSLRFKQRFCVVQLLYFIRCHRILFPKQVQSVFSTVRNAAQDT